MEFVNQLDHEDYEYAAQFLEMAARLIYIKTCYLLPREEEAKELKRELEGELIEYSQCKAAAENLRKMYMGADVFVRTPMDIPVNKTYSRVHSSQALVEAYLNLSEITRDNKPLKAEIFKPIVAKKFVSVTSKITYLLTKLYRCGQFEMDKLYDGMNDKSERVATFLAVLELTKSGKIYLNDDNSMIYFNKDADDMPDEEEKFEQTAEQSLDEGEEDDFEEDSVLEEKSKGVEFVSELTKSARERIKREEFLQISCKQTANEQVDFDEENGNEEDFLEENFVEEIYFEVVSEDEKNGRQIADDCKEKNRLDEVEILQNLPDKYPADVFKPNFWGRIKYRWGSTTLGECTGGGYWIYGRYII